MGTLKLQTYYVSQTLQFPSWKKVNMDKAGSVCLSYNFKPLKIDTCVFLAHPGHAYLFLA